MSLYWYACISTNTYCFETYHILLKTDWWVLFNTSSIVWIRLVVHEILADKAFTATDGLISQSFVVAFVPPTYIPISLIWGFPVQLGLWKSVHWLWRYKLNKVCDTTKLLNWPMQKMDLGSKWLAIQIHYVLMLLELLQIMLLSVNIGLGSSLEKNLSVCAVNIWSNQDNIFSINMPDSMATRIWE